MERKAVHLRGKSARMDERENLVRGTKDYCLRKTVA